jgi:hypothetical protein
MGEVIPIRPGQWYEQGLLFDPSEYIRDIDPRNIGSPAVGELIYIEFGVAEHDPFIDDLNGLPNDYPDGA